MYTFTSKELSGKIENVKNNKNKSKIFIIIRVTTFESFGPIRFSFILWTLRWSVYNHHQKRITFRKILYKKKRRNVETFSNYKTKTKMFYLVRQNIERIKDNCHNCYHFKVQLQMEVIVTLPICIGQYPSLLHIKILKNHNL